MKKWIPLFFSAVIGFVVVTLLLNNFTFDFTVHGSTITIIFLVIIFILLVISVVLYRQIRNLNSKEVYGDDEDEVDSLIYKKFTDYSFFVQSSLTFSLLALSISVTITEQIFLTVLAILFLLISYLLSMLVSHLTQLIYPERNLPRFSEKNYAEKLLEASDEGERHVMLIGFYKSYNLLSVALVVAILLSTVYSMSSGESQVFSIILMASVLLLVHGKYCLSIRNK
ncbi:DUF3169 family protein [Bacillus luteolus]|uniref:DUF3169 family protein n=1 Tax=Litchfieldia luteola TaxID=682179 RepID=A0ABR9QDM3_9BACI|nr:DUF3169 family protein [Cytobacillus luteolus]MBE4906526.1 DUF3169 family protein [Cytobacillus luteolus]MBP1941210.1 magnesium-transporting ATPase (P-type) [Cytobacillus luteolus]